MAKKRIVATKLMKVEVTATGSGTPARRMAYIVIGPAPEVERRDVPSPRAHPAGQEHADQRRTGMHVSRHHPEPQTSTQPVHRRQSQPHEHPYPVNAADASQEGLKVVSINQRDPKAYEGGQKGKFEAAEEKLGREQTGHEGPKVGRQG